MFRMLMTSVAAGAIAMAASAQTTVTLLSTNDVDQFSHLPAFQALLQPSVLPGAMCCSCTLVTALAPQSSPDWTRGPYGRSAEPSRSRFRDRR